MEYTLLPSFYEAKIKKETEDFENAQKTKISSNASRIDKEYSDKIAKIQSHKDKSFDAYMFLIFVIGGFLWLVLLVAVVVVEMIQSPASFFNSILVLVFGAILGFIGSAILSIVICPIGYPIYRCICNKIDNKNENKKFFLEKERQNALSNMEKPILGLIEQHERECFKKINEYREVFEKEAQTLSVKYANSELAHEVIEWLSGGFIRTVRAVNRASHIESIRVPFEYYVEKHEIRCNIGKYNFEEHRCERLESVLEQTALARAIASQIQLKMIMNYDKDESGTEYKIEIKYSYPQPITSSSYSYRVEQPDYVTVDLVYTAINGNYKAVQKW